MHHLELLSPGFCAILDLEVAAWVGSCNDGGAGSSDVVEFPGEQLLRHFRLDNVVNPGTPAAPGG